MEVRRLYCEGCLTRAWHKHMGPCKIEMRRSTSIEINAQKKPFLFFSKMHAIQCIVAPMDTDAARHHFQKLQRTFEVWRSLDCHYALNLVLGLYAQRLNFLIRLYWKRSENHPWASARSGKRGHFPTPGSGNGEKLMKYGVFIGFALPWRSKIWQNNVKIVLPPPGKSRGRPWHHWFLASRSPEHPTFATRTAGRSGDSRGVLWCQKPNIFWAIQIRWGVRGDPRGVPLMPKTKYFPSYSLFMRAKLTSTYENKIEEQNWNARTRLESCQRLLRNEKF